MFRNNKPGISILGILLLVGTGLWAQSYEGDVRKIVQKMDSCKALHIVAEAKMYKDGASAPFFTLNSSVDYSSKGVITRMGERELYRNSSHEISLDHEEKMIIVHPLGKHDLSSVPNKSLKEIQQFLQDESNLNDSRAVKELVSDVNSIRTYRIKGLKEYDEMTVVLDMNNGSILEVRFVFSSKGQYKGQTCIVNYQMFDYAPSFGSDHFSMEKYFRIQGGKKVPASKFSHYKLIEQ